MPVSSGDRLGDELDRLAGMDLPTLASRWRRVFGRAVPPGLSRALLHRALAYRIQADALGGLDRETSRALDRMAGPGGGEVIPMPEQRGRKPGTLLVREWQGAMHSVMVLEQGFAWNGQTYASLSEVARAITGTSWNGPRFFGLRDKSKGSRDRRRAA
jgi:hypothetical protein